MPDMWGVPCKERFTIFPIYLNYSIAQGSFCISSSNNMNYMFCVFLSGYWSITVYGRKHCYRLYTKHFNEAVHWACAIQKIIDTKAPVETPTQLLIRDIEVGHTTCTQKHTVLFPPPPLPSFLLCYQGNHTTSLCHESKVFSGCLSLLNDLILFQHTETGHNNRPEAERSFQDKGISSY